MDKEELTPLEAAERLVLVDRELQRLFKERKKLSKYIKGRTPLLELIKTDTNEKIEVLLTNLETVEETVNE